MQVTIGEAARHLGLSEHTVRRQVHNGKLSGNQVATPQGYTWRVEIDNDPSALDPNPGPAPASGPANGETEFLREIIDIFKAEAATFKEQLRAQLEAKDNQLEAKDNQIQELHILLQQQAALTAPKETRRWWQFWS